MKTRRRRRTYKFTEKKQSKRGMLGLGLAVLSLGILAAVIWNSFVQSGNGSMYLGSAGVASMLLGIVSLVVSIMSLGEENSFKLFPYLATVASFLATGIWVALYVIGFVL